MATKTQCTQVINHGVRTARCTANATGEFGGAAMCTKHRRFWESRPTTYTCRSCGTEGLPLQDGRPVTPLCSDHRI